MHLVLSLPSSQQVPAREGHVIDLDFGYHQVILAFTAC